MIDKIEREVNKAFPNKNIKFKPVDMGYIIEVDDEIIKTKLSHEVREDLSKLYFNDSVCSILIDVVIEEISRELGTGYDR